MTGTGGTPGIAKLSEFVLKLSEVVLKLSDVVLKLSGTRVEHLV